MRKNKDIRKELAWDKKEVYEADAERLLKIMKKKEEHGSKSNKVKTFYDNLDKIRIKL